MADALIAQTTTVSNVKAALITVSHVNKGTMPMTKEHAKRVVTPA
jgi:hypothetical protein